MGRHVVVLLLGLAAVCVAAPAAAPAAGGTLDPAFGPGGTVTTVFPNTRFSGATALALQPDGKLVAAGSAFDLFAGSLVALARYAPDGTLDPSFGTGGLVTTDVSGLGDTANGVAIQADGRIVIAGSLANTSSSPSDAKFELLRYNPDGSLDTSFGVGGKVLTPVGLPSGAMAVVLQPDGRIVAGGFGHRPFGQDFALVRYLPDGTLDPSFGTLGRVTTELGTPDDGIWALALQPDGRIVAVGERNGLGGFAMARYLPDGNLDLSFGVGGLQTGGAPAFGRAVALQQDGRIVVGSGGFAVSRFGSDGLGDPGFGSGGTTTLDFGAPFPAVNAVAVASDGKILAAGESQFPGAVFALARLNAGGALDTGFGTGGKVTTLIQGRGGRLRAMVLQPDGKIVVAGASGGFALARYLGLGTLDNTPPETTIDSGPADGSLVNSPLANFSFAGSDDVTAPDALRFECSLDGALFASCSSPQTYGGLADGGHIFAVRAIDEAGNVDPTPATRAWTVDTIPPAIFVTATPSVLWPPDHRLVAVTLSVTAGDASGIAGIELVTVTSNEPDDGLGDGDASADIQGAALGTDDRAVLLRAERAGTGQGRIYTLVYRATDRAGNSATAAAAVRVSHDRGDP